MNPLYNAFQSPLMAQFNQFRQTFKGDPRQQVQQLLNSGSEFAEAVEGLSPSAILPVMDELMTTLQVVNPRLYAAVMRKIEVL